MAAEISQKCDKLQGLTETQRKVIGRHLSRHKWFRHITNELDAVNDFMSEFGPIMREMYCEGCEKSKECLIYQDYLAGKIKIYKLT